MKRILSILLILTVVPMVSAFTQIATGDEVEKLLAPQSDSAFGSALATTGDWLLVGAPQADETGLVYAYDCASMCELVGVLAHSALEADDQFGVALAAFDDVLLVGAVGDDDNGPDAGAVYVFPDFVGCIDTDTCAGVLKLLPSDGGALSAFGQTLAYDGDWAVVGAPEDSNFADSRAGAVYAFENFLECPEFDPERIGQTECNEVHKLLASDGASVDSFGYSISLDGDSVAVGAPDDDNATGVNGGSVYYFPDITECPAYNRNNERWTQCNEDAKLLADEDQIGLRFGHSVALSDDVLVVGAPDARRVGPKSGAVFVYTSVGDCPKFYRGRELSTQCNEDAQLRARAARRDGYFGAGLIFDGTSLLVAASGSFTSATPEIFPGRLFVYESVFDCPEFDPNIFSSLPCLQDALIAAPDDVDADLFASAMALGVDRLYVSALSAADAPLPASSSTNPTPTPSVSSRDGAVYVFSLATDDVDG